MVLASILTQVFSELFLTASDFGLKHWVRFYPDLELGLGERASAARNELVRSHAAILITVVK